MVIFRHSNANRSAVDLQASDVAPGSRSEIFSHVQTNLNRSDEQFCDIVLPTLASFFKYYCSSRYSQKIVFIGPNYGQQHQPQKYEPLLRIALTTRNWEMYLVKNLRALLMSTDP